MKKNKTKHRDSLVLVLGQKIRFGLLIAFGLIALLDMSPLSRAWDDLMVRVLMTSEISRDRVTIVDIDDRSLAAVGRWPWKRSELAAFVSLLSMQEPRAIGIDLFFPEEGDAGDSMLVESLTASPNVVLAMAFDFESSQRVGQLPLNFGPDEKVVSEIGWIGFFPNLARAIEPYDFGHVNIEPGPDGVVRHLTGQVSLDEQTISSFPSQIIKLIRNEELPTLGNGDHRVPYAFDPRGLVTVSALDILEGTAPVELVKNRVLLVGSSAAGLSDRVLTPLGTALPGVALQAMVIEAWLQGIVWKDAPLINDLVLLSALTLAAFSLLCITKMTHSRWVFYFGMAALTVLGLNGFDRWWSASIWDPVPWVSVCFVVMGALIYQLYMSQKIAADRVRSMFQSYVPSTVLDQLLSGDVSRFDQGERTRVTILFADLIGFTPYAEASDPAELTRTMRQVFNTLTENILKHGGTVDKYMGDGVMAFWGAPLVDHDQASNAVQCAVDMQSAIEALPFSLSLGVGINTGEVTVGNMGSDFRHAYSVLGDAVNIAARLEGQTRVLGKSILMGEATAKECLQPTRSLGTIAVKGKRECIEVFCLQLS